MFGIIAFATMLGSATISDSIALVEVKAACEFRVILPRQQGGRTGLWKTSLENVVFKGP